jgi:arginine N-succinyltransferase
MYVIRRAHQADMDILLKLAKMVHFINLPADKDIISEKIDRSRRSFRAVHEKRPLDVRRGDRSAVGNSPVFLFSMDDTTTGNCLGTSMIVARMGGPGHPNISFEIHKRHFFSEDLQQGTSHTVAKLVLDESGPTEIGGLILGPSYRGHPTKLGKQLSLIRFHYIGLHREQFADRILAEMMAPITPDGQNTLWEYLGRRFINLPYTEADKFCQRSREFMISLLPREPIYLSLLPPEARKLVGQVGPDTVPARRMLEDLGFKYTNRIDPFDGGPHLEALTDQIPLVRDTRVMPYAGTCSTEEATQRGFVSVDHEGGEFRATYSPYQLAPSEDRVLLPAETVEALGVHVDEPIGFTPIDLRIKSAAVPQQPQPVGA